MSDYFSVARLIEQRDNYIELDRLGDAAHKFLVSPGHADKSLTPEVGILSSHNMDAINAYMFRFKNTTEGTLGCVGLIEKNTDDPKKPVITGMGVATANVDILQAKEKPKSRKDMTLIASGIILSAWTTNTEADAVSSLLGEVMTRAIEYLPRQEIFYIHPLAVATARRKFRRDNSKKVQVDGLIGSFEPEEYPESPGKGAQFLRTRGFLVRRDSRLGSPATFGALFSNIKE